MKKKNLYWLVESAVMIALAAVLELVAKMIIPEMPFGGQVTIAGKKITSKHLLVLPKEMVHF